jgi:hypothetical protein
MSNTDYFDYMKDRDRRSLMSQPLGISNVGYMDDTTSVDPSNYLASLLGQGAAMFGAGIAGRDPGRVSEGINDMRVFEDRMRQAQAQQKQEALFRQQAQEEQRTKNEQLIKNQQEALQFKKDEQTKEEQKLEKEAKLQVNAEDSKSEISKKQRMLYGNIFGININENISANDLTKPGVLQGLKEMGERKRQEEALAKQQKLLPRGGGGGVRQPKQPKPEKESKEQKELDEFTSQAESLKESLQDYRKAIKAIPLTGGAAQKEKAKTLARSLLLKMKTVEKTGSLDAGSIDVIESIIGTPDYTRDEVVDAKIDQALMTLNRNVESETRGKNGLNKKYKPFIPFEANEMDAQIINNYFNNPNDPNYIDLYNKLRSRKGF